MGAQYKWRNLGFESPRMGQRPRVQVVLHQTIRMKYYGGESIQEIAWKLIKGGVKTDRSHVLIICIIK